jgi:hypothetical protein
MKPSALLFAILIYVTLDLSLPAMPGAFEFEPADSVESIQTHRGRATAEFRDLPAPARDEVVLSQPRIEITYRLARPSSTQHRHPVVSRLPRSLRDNAPRSEDPH